MRDLARGDVEAVIIDLVGAALDLSPVEIDSSSQLDGDGLGADSLTLIELATAVSTFFRLHENELEDELLRRRTVGDWTDTVMRSWTYGSRCLTFTTSGSTGTSTHCTHTWDVLAQELDVHAEIFADRTRVVGLVGPRHIYGFLFCALLPRWLGVPFVDGRTRVPTSLGTLARPGDLIVGFPLRWDLATAVPTWPSRVVGVTSTGPIAATTVAALRRHGLERMVEIYGSSETGGMAWRDDPTDPFQLYAHWTMAEDGRMYRAGPDVEAPTEAFEAPDVLKSRGDGFDVVGRRDNAIQVAGVNVSCARVAAMVAEHPSVRECAVRLMRPEEGTRLKAYVVLEAGIGEGDVRPLLRAWLRTRLSAPETPTRLTFGTVLPVDAHGKAADWPADGDGAAR